MMDLKLLLIEEPDAQAQVTLQLLKKVSNPAPTIIHTNCVRAAITHLGTSKFDAILLNLEPPESTAKHNIAQILAHAADTPIIVISSIDDVECAIKMLNAGAQDFISRADLSKSLLKCAISKSIERKKIEGSLLTAKTAAEEANRAKNIFLANMSHEIRTPLGVMLGFTELLTSTDICKEDRANFISALKRNSKLLTQIIDDVLDLSKIEAGKLILNYENVEISSLVNDLELSFQQQMKEKNLSFCIFLDRQVPAVIKTDLMRLRQILYNILSNAIKFTEAGMINLHISASPVKNYVYKLFFSVQDTGIGIDKNQWPNLFVPFGQVTQDKAKYGGTGLGLVLSRKLANLLGGDVVLRDSTVGKGSTFESYVEAEIVDESKYYEGQKAMKNTQANLNFLDGIKILVVDDSPDNQLIISRYLSSAGGQVDLASNGSDAIMKANSYKYDVLLMDLRMPIMDGYQTTSELRRNGYQTPIIAVTAHALAEEKQRCLNSGFNDFISKPISRETLVETVYHLARP